MKQEEIEITYTFTIEEFNAIIDAMAAGIAFPTPALMGTQKLDLWQTVLDELAETVNRTEDVELFQSCCYCEDTDTDDCFTMDTEEDKKDMREYIEEQCE